MTTEQTNLVLVAAILAIGVPWLLLYARQAARADRRRDRAERDLVERRER